MTCRYPDHGPSALTSITDTNSSTICLPVPSGLTVGTHSSLATMSTPSRRRDDYTVACICPMGVELAAMTAIFDEEHPTLPTSRDQNAYRLGKIGGHDVVVATMSNIDNNNAATVATQLLNDFPNVRFGLLVGVGGGVPGRGKRDDIRLGDVVVSEPRGTLGGVVQFDRGDETAGAGFKRTGSLNKPPPVLSSHMESLKARHDRDGSRIHKLIQEALERYPNMRAKYSRPLDDEDKLYEAGYRHESGDDCEKCDKTRLVQRGTRSNDEPVLHYGTIGSSNKRIMNGLERERLKADVGIICVEMEAAGLMDYFPCLVVRGICDYADSHKNQDWQPYAAMVAAAYAKELLLYISPAKARQEPSIKDVLGE
jgi:nucleoside phosphorylase